MQYQSLDGEIIKDKLTLEEANELEEKTIKEYMTNDPEYGYNCHSGGNNHSINEITREKMSKNQTGIGNNFYRHKHSESSKKMISESQIGEKNSFYGKHHNEETKKKISESGKGRHLTEKQKEALKMSNKNRVFTDDTKQKNEGYKNWIIYWYLKSYG